MNKKIALTIVAAIIFFAGGAVAFAAPTIFEIHFANVSSPFWGRGSGTSVEKIAEKYIPQSDQRVCGAQHAIAAFFGPTDSVVLSVYASGTIPEAGTLIASSSIAASALPVPTGIASSFTFSSCISLQASSSYWFVVSRTSPNAGNGYISMYRPSSEYAYSSYWQYNGFDPRGWQQDLNREWSLSLIGEEPRKEPVIIVPGILGSELGQGNELLWPNLARMTFDINDEFLSAGLAMDGAGNSVNQITVGNAVEGIFSTVPFVGVHIFDELKADLRSAGYVDNVSLFALPYDWRIDLGVTKDLLHQKIEEIKHLSGFGKVNLIAHSMGGLLVKAYAQAYGADSIDKLIFIGTPHLGAPKAARVLLEGDRFNIPFLEEDAMKAIALNAPAVYELLPFPDYIAQFTGYLKGPSGTQQLDYATAKNFLISKGLNWNLLDKAEQFAAMAMSGANLSGTNTVNIAGCQVPTEAGYEFDSFGQIKDIKYISGDETVPLPSGRAASAINARQFYFKGGTHAELPSEQSVRDATVSILSDAPVVGTADLSSSDSFCGFFGKEMLWRSPVDVHIYDALGRHTGPIADNSIEYGIPGVAYDIIGHRKFVFLPTDSGQEYNITGKGTDNGTFDLVIRDNGNGVTTDTAFFNDIAITDRSVATFDLGADFDTTSITVDKKGDGQGAVVSPVTPTGLIIDIERSFAAGWITEKSVKNDLIKKVQTSIRLQKRVVRLKERLLGKPKIIKQIERLEEKIDKVLGEQFLNELEKQYKKGRINEQAYQLLREDLEWLLDH